MMIVMKEGASDHEVQAVIQRVKQSGAHAHVSRGHLTTVIGVIGDRDEAAVVDGLAERGVVVRAGEALGGDGSLRVTYGTRSENERFLAALDEVLEAVTDPAAAR